jgi:hypothetical protein
MVSSGTSGCEHETEENINAKAPASGSLKLNVKSKKTLNRGSLKGSSTVYCNKNFKARIKLKKFTYVTDRKGWEEEFELHPKYSYLPQNLHINLTGTATAHAGMSMD